MDNRIRFRAIFFTMIAMIFLVVLACSGSLIPYTIESPSPLSTMVNKYPSLALDWTLSYKSPSKNLSTFAEFHKKLYVGGFTVQSDGKIYVYDGKSWSDLNFSSPDGFTIDMVNSMYTFNDILYIGTRVHDQNNNYYARVYSYDEKIFSIEFSANGIQGCSGIQDLKVYQDILYAANGSCGYGEVFKRNATGDWKSVGGSMHEGIPVIALASYNGKLYAGTGCAGQHAQLWQWNNTNWELVHDFYQAYGSDGISSITSNNNNLYIGLSSSATIPFFDGQGWNKSLEIPQCAGTVLTNTGGRVWAGACNGDIYVNESGSWSQAGFVEPAISINNVFQFGDYVYLATYPSSIYRAFMPPKQ